MGNRDTLRNWLERIGKNGWIYPEAAKNEDWNEAMETMKAMGDYDTPTLLKMRRALREASERRLIG